MLREMKRLRTGLTVLLMLAFLSGGLPGPTNRTSPASRRRTTSPSPIRHDGFNVFDLGAGDGSGANGINSYGDVVGVFGAELSDAGTYERASFVYLEDFQQLVDLDDVVVGDEADLLLWLDETSTKVGQRINDVAQIAGDLSTDLYLYDIGLHAFILTPTTAGN